MNVTADRRARSSWLLAFGDVITLLITFFIMVIALNNAQVSKLQRWTDQQITVAYQSFAEEIKNQGLQVISVTQTPQGILFAVQSSAAFNSADYYPSQQLLGELQYLGSLLRENRLFNLQNLPQEAKIIDYALDQGMQWKAEIVIEGHTDNDPILPTSPLRNNWFLSAMRAQTVMDELFKVSQLPADLFSISGYSEYHPVADNGSEAGKELNRRIEILLTAGFEKLQEAGAVAN